MDKILIVVFDSEKKAYEGLKALKELDAEGSIELYSTAVIAKDGSGNVTVKQAADEGPLGSAVGMLTGSLIGLLGGPAGVVIGAGAGMIGGGLYDLARVGVGEDFLGEVDEQLRPGKTALVAEVWEEWVMPVDTRMASADGIVFRRARGEVLDALIERDTAAQKAEFAQLKEEYARASREARAKLQTKLDGAKAKLQATQERAKAAFEAAKQETDAKAKSLQQKVTKSQGEAKAKLQTRIDKIRSEHKQRSEKLHQAWELTKEALAV